MWGKQTLYASWCDEIGSLWHHCDSRVPSKVEPESNQLDLLSIWNGLWGLEEWVWSLFKRGNPECLILYTENEWVFPKNNGIEKVGRKQGTLTE